MVKYPPREALRDNIDLTFHGLCTHISKDLQSFIKRHIFANMKDLDGVSLRELDVLMCVAYFKEPVTPTDVADTIRFDPATVTRASHNLLEKGFLIKTGNLSDSRSALLSMTESGQALAHRFSETTRAALRAANEYMTKTLTHEEQEEFLRLLLKMRNRSMEYASLKKLEVSVEAEMDNIYDMRTGHSISA